jgi:hypothetical protein
MALEDLGEAVYYAAPEFHTRDQLNNAYASRNVVQSSAFFSPSEIGRLPSRDQHFVSFLPGANIGYRFSEPKRIKKSFLDAILRDDLHAKIPLARHRSAASFRELGDKIVDLHRHFGGAPIGEEQDSVRRVRQERDPRSYLSYVGQTLLGCVVLFQVNRDS